jgi:hemerythrin superfamily protein
MTTWIDLLRADHERINGLFTEFSTTNDGTIVGQIIDALSVHDSAEHGALYPLAAQLLKDPKIVARALDAHSSVKTLIEQLRNLEGEPLVAAVGRLQQLVADHVQDEENNLVPALSKRCTPAQAEVLTARFEQVKQRVG